MKVEMNERGWYIDSDIQMYDMEEKEMSMISFRVTDEERDELNEASKMYGGSLSNMIKTILFERLHDDYDIKLALDFERKLANGEVKTRNIRELAKEAGIDYDSLCD